MKNNRLKEYYKTNPYIHYSNCHEDVNVVLRCADKPKNILSIASALDNSLSLLTLDPDKVIAIDLNPSQIYLSNVKKMGIKYLTYDEFLILLGIKEGDSYSKYLKIKEYLDTDTISYFEKNSFLISKIKLVNCGRFEYYFNVFKNKVLANIHTKATIDKFMSFNDLEEQKKYYYKKFNNIRFKLLFKIFFSSFVMKRIGRDKNYFKYNKGKLADLLKSRFELGIKNNLNKDNPYLQYVIYNKFNTLPHYLIEENFNKIKQNIDRLEIKLISFEKQLESDIKYDYMNLSDIFEYMSEDKTKELSNIIYGRLNDNGRVIFWNMKNKRSFDNELKRLDTDLRNDLTFYYQDFYLYKR